MKGIKYYLTADSHFGHKHLIKWGRPEDFMEKILSNMENNIEKDGVYIHLGDICMGRDSYWHKELISKLFPSTKKWLIKGNHDKKSDSWYMSNGWDFVAENITIKKFGLEIIFSHIPVDVRNMGDDVLNIHGHFHDSDFRKHEPHLAEILCDRNLLVAQEYLNYTPITLHSFLRQNGFA